MFFGGEGTFTISLALHSLGNRLTRQNYMVLVDFYQVLKGACLRDSSRFTLRKGRPLTLSLVGTVLPGKLSPLILLLIINN